jgi:hypothetical protein
LNEKFDLKDYGFTSGRSIREFATLEENSVDVSCLSKKQQKAYFAMWKRAREYHTELRTKEMHTAVADGRMHSSLQPTRSARVPRAEPRDHDKAAAEEAAAEKQRSVQNRLQKEAEKQLACKCHFLKLFF